MGTECVDTKFFVGKVLKRRVHDFIEFFFKAQSNRHREKKFVAPLKRVYLDAFRSYEAGDYVEIQQNDQNRRYVSRINVKNR